MPSLPRNRLRRRRRSSNTSVSLVDRICRFASSIFSCLSCSWQSDAVVPFTASSSAVSQISDREEHKSESPKDAPQQWQMENDLVAEDVSESISIPYFSEPGSSESHWHQEEDGTTLNQPDTVIERLTRPAVKVLRSTPAVESSDVQNHEFYAPGTVITDKSGETGNTLNTRCPTPFSKTRSGSTYSGAAVAKFEKDNLSLHPIEEIQHAEAKSTTIKDNILGRSDAELDTNATSFETRKSTLFWHTENKLLNYAAKCEASEDLHEQEIEELQDVEVSPMKNMPDKGEDIADGLFVIGNACQQPQSLSQKPSDEQEKEIDRILLGNMEEIETERMLAWEPTDAEIREQQRRAKLHKKKEKKAKKEGERLKNLSEKKTKHADGNALPSIDGDKRGKQILRTDPDVSELENVEAKKKKKQKKKKERKQEEDKVSEANAWEKEKMVAHECMVKSEENGESDCELTLIRNFLKANFAAKQAMNETVENAKYQHATKMREHSACENELNAAMKPEYGGTESCIADGTGSSAGEKRRKKKVYKLRKKNKVGAITPAQQDTFERDEEEEQEFTAEQLEFFHPRNRPTSRERPPARGDPAKFGLMLIEVPLTPPEIVRNEVTGHCCKYHDYLVKLYEYKMKNKNMTPEERREAEIEQQQLMMSACYSGTKPDIFNKRSMAENCWGQKGHQHKTAFTESRRRADLNHGIGKTTMGQSGTYNTKNNQERESGFLPRIAPGMRYSHKRRSRH